MHPAVVPGAREFIRGHGDRREGAGRLRLHKAKPFAKLCGNEVAQTPVIDEHDELHVHGARCRRRTERHVVGHDGNFGLKINAMLLAHERRSVAGAQQRVRSALIHERIGEE